MLLLILLCCISHITLSQRFWIWTPPHAAVSDVDIDIDDIFSEHQHASDPDEYIERRLSHSDHPATQHELTTNIRDHLDFCCDYVEWDDAHHYFYCIKEGKSAQPKWIMYCPDFKFEFDSEISPQRIIASGSIISGPATVLPNKPTDAPIDVDKIFIAPINNHYQPIAMIIPTDNRHPLSSPHWTFFEPFFNRHNVEQTLNDYFDGNYIYQHIQTHEWESTATQIFIADGYRNYNGLIVFNNWCKLLPGFDEWQFINIYLQNLERVHVQHTETHRALWQYKKNDYFRMVHELLHDVEGAKEVVLQPKDPWDLLSTFMNHPYHIQWQYHGNSKEYIGKGTNKPRGEEEGLDLYIYRTEHDRHNAELYMFGIEHNKNIQNLVKALTEIKPDIIFLEYDYSRFIPWIEHWTAELREFPAANKAAWYIAFQDRFNEFMRIWDMYKYDRDKQIVFVDLPPQYVVPHLLFKRPHSKTDPYDLISMNVRNHGIAQLVNGYVLRSWTHHAAIKCFLLVGAAHTGFDPEQTNDIFPHWAPYRKQFALHQLFTVDYDKIESVFRKDPSNKYYIRFNQYPMTSDALKEFQRRNKIYDAHPQQSEESVSHSHRSEVGATGVQIPHPRHPEAKSSQIRRARAIGFDELYELNGYEGYSDSEHSSSGYSSSGYSPSGYYFHVVSILCILIVLCFISCIMYFCGFATLCIIAQIKWNINKQQRNNHIADTDNIYIDYQI